jgi:hypothetical protein
LFSSKSRFDCEAGWDGVGLEVVGEVLQHRQQRFRFARHLYFPNDLACLIHKAAVATYWAACRRWPKAKVTLRQGTPVVHKNWHDELDRRGRPTISCPRCLSGARLPEPRRGKMPGPRSYPRSGLSIPTLPPNLACVYRACRSRPTLTKAALRAAVAARNSAQWLRRNRPQPRAMKCGYSFCTPRRLCARA